MRMYTPPYGEDDMVEPVQLVILPASLGAEERVMDTTDGLPQRLTILCRPALDVHTQQLRKVKF